MCAMQSLPDVTSTASEMAGSNALRGMSLVLPCNLHCFCWVQQAVAYRSLSPAAGVLQENCSNVTLKSVNGALRAVQHNMQHCHLHQESDSNIALIISYNIAHTALLTFRAAPPSPLTRSGSGCPSMLIAALAETMRGGRQAHPCSLESN